MEAMNEDARALGPRMRPRTPRRWTPFVENITESTTACLVTMVQGNLLILGLGHWIIASRTGVIAGAVASLVLLLVRTRNRWATSLVLGVLTAIVDYFVHPGQFGSAATEAVVTGFGAAVLSYGVGALIRRFRRGADSPQLGTELK